MSGKTTAPNSWVHKQYMSERDFEIEHAVDDHYHDIAPHYHEFYELFLFIGGHVDYIVDDGLFRLQRGDLLIIPPSVIHNPIFRDFDEHYDRFVLWVSAQCMQRLIRQDPDLGIFRREDKRRMYLFRSPGAAWNSLNGSFLTLYRTCEQRGPCWKSEFFSTLLHVMAAYNRALLGHSGQTLRGSRSSLLTNILHYISDNLCGDLSLETVASVFYSNKFSISHMFKQDMHISFYQYVIQMRLLAGKALLLEGMPAAKVWEACGFSDHAGFYRAFKKWYGVSPSQFTKLHTALLAPTESQP